MSSRARKLRGFRSLADDEIARLTVHGAAGEVTGSLYLLETPAGRVLIECGLIQGAPREEARNARRFPFDPRGLDAVVLTHAHIDHSGRLPKLVKDGFRGPVHCTGGTSDLLSILLPDCAHIHELEAAQRSRRLLRRGKAPVEPLYSADDADRALEHRNPCAFDSWHEILPDVRARFRRAGHILGASALELDLDGGRRLVVSGDVGRRHEPLLRDPDPPDRADVLLLESTYGDRDHRSYEDSMAELADVLGRAERDKANVIVPVFAVGRAQELLLQIGRLEKQGAIRPRPVFLDSPMAISVTELYARHVGSFGPTVRRAIEAGEQLGPASLHLCRTPEESMALNDRRDVTILAASGMCNAGRVVHHLKHNLWRGAHVVIAGFQARGTVGRALVDGARNVRLLGETIAVRSEIHTVGGFSAHGGQSELLEFSERMVEGGARVALVHGEPDRRSALREQLRKRSRHEVWLPAPGAGIRILRRGPGVVFEQAP